MGTTVLHILPQYNRQRVDDETPTIVEILVMGSELNAR